MNSVKEPLDFVEERKNLKRNNVLGTIRYGSEISRHEVKKSTKYSMTTVLNTISELLSNNLIYEEECLVVRSGRRPTWLHINPTGAFAIGIEFNANRLTCEIVDFSFCVVYEENTDISPTDSSDQLINKILSAVRKAINYLGDNESKIVGIGVGLPGYIDKDTGVAISYAYLDAWKNIPIKEILENAFSYKVIIENNVNATAVAYRWKTYEQHADDFIFVSLRYGIRMSMFINNKLFTGSGNAGEIGHTRLATGTHFCSCGRRGCLDAEVSVKAIRQKVAERVALGLFPEINKQIGGDYEKITVDMLINEVFEGNPDAIDLLSEIADYLSQCLAVVMASVNPKRIIITSKSGMGGSIFADMIMNYLSDSVSPALLTNLSVKSIKIDDSHGARGAAMMVMEDEYKVFDYEF